MSAGRGAAGRTDESGRTATRGVADRLSASEGDTPFGRMLRKGEKGPLRTIGSLLSALGNLFILRLLKTLEAILIFRLEQW